MGDNITTWGWIGRIIHCKVQIKAEDIEKKEKRDVGIHGSFMERKSKEILLEKGDENSKFFYNFVNH